MVRGFVWKKIPGKPCHPGTFSHTNPLNISEIWTATCIWMVFYWSGYVDIQLTANPHRHSTIELEKVKGKGLSVWSVALALRFIFGPFKLIFSGFLGQHFPRCPAETKQLDQYWIHFRIWAPLWRILWSAATLYFKQKADFALATDRQTPLFIEGSPISD